MTITAIATTPAAQWLTAMTELNQVRPFLPSNEAWRKAIEKTRALAPTIPRASKERRRYADIALYLHQRNPSIIRSYNGLKLVERQDWNEHIIRFPHFFPEDLIRESLDDNRLWSLWVKGNQWVSEQCGSIGPAAAGGLWAHWWETADFCDWP